VMRSVLAAIAVILMGFGASPALAQTFPMLGDGNESCATWSADRESNQSADDQQWILGYITAANGLAMVATKHTVKMNTDINGVFAWIDNFCQKTPTDNLTQAAVSAWSSSEIDGGGD